MERMKESRSYTLALYELVAKLINVDNMKNKVLKFFIAVVMLPVLLLFIFLALCIEEPLKCVFAVIFRQTDISGALNHYKKCWSKLLDSMRI